MSFKNLKRRSASNKIEDLVEQASKMKEAGGKKNFQKDERLWKPTKDAAGNGFAEIRFLPGADGETHWGRYWDHGFKDKKTGQWYIERSLSSLDKDDPCLEYNSELWNAEEGKDTPGKIQARHQKRRMHYVSNVLIVSDPGCPENEGKVMLYEYGVKIFEKLMDAMQEDTTGDPDAPKPIDPFDMWKGANFKLKVRKVDGWPNYDKSTFGTPGPIGTDEEMEKMFGTIHDLEDYCLGEQHYKTYDELQKRLMKVVGAALGKPATLNEALVEREAPAPVEKEVEAPKAAKEEEAPEGDTDDGEDNEDTVDSMAYFAALAEKADD